MSGSATAERQDEQPCHPQNGFCSLLILRRVRMAFGVASVGVQFVSRVSFLWVSSISVKLAKGGEYVYPRL
jgi:hypothetical protein